MAQHNDTGRWGENVACELLVTKGYAIAARNHRIGNYEIDIIATKGDRMAFVEVKTRSALCSDPTLAIDRKRMNRLTAAANSFIRGNQLRYSPQIDVIAISGAPDNYKIEHFEDAFLPPLRTR